ncbi:hypothetical protein NVV37_24455 [Escherichia coli]|nr:hypothetical protein [Escherichia coli]
MKKIMVSIALLLTIILGLSFNVKASEVNWDRSYWDSLDCGIYWYGMDNKPYKFVSGQTNPAFDPSKPTIIYIHGWQPEYYLLRHRESFYIYGKDTADDWIKKGWNAVFFMTFEHKIYLLVGWAGGFYYFIFWGAPNPAKAEAA